MRPDRAAEHRFAAWHRKVTAERDLTAVVLAGMDLWRFAVYTAITEHQPNREQILAGGFFQHLWRLDNAAAAARTWLRWVDGAVAPSISAVFGEAFNQVRKTATISPQPYEAAHMATVHDRLVIWPDGAFEDLRPELEEALSEAESIGQVQDRVGAVLGIDKMTREHRARINEINRILDDPDADPADRAELLAQKAQLWRDHDESLQDWEWMARRIARTEVQGAVEAGQYEAARASESQLGITLWKRWISTPDTRTRHSHWLADGQAVRLAERFTVGTAQLLYPADPSSGAASEIINCVVGSTRVAWPGQSVEGLTRRRYRGTFVHLRTADGHELTVTPNHPVLTTAGYRPAGVLRPGDRVLATRLLDAPDVGDVPPRIEELFGSVGEARVQKRVVLRGVDFHGDVLEDDEVDVVWPDGDLHAVADVQSAGDASEDVLVVPVGGRSGDPTSPRAGEAGGGLWVRSGERERLAPAAGDVRGLGERAALRDVHPPHADSVRLAPVPDGQAQLGEAPNDGRTADSDDLRHLQDARALGMEPTQLVEVEFSFGDHYVYNLTTSGAWYVSNGIAIHNCRCSLAYWERDELQAELQGPDGSIGEVVPQGVRLGPDDPAVVDAKVAELEAVDDQHTDTRTEDWAPPLTAAGIRYVRTAEGARRYKRPIGSVIGGTLDTPHLNDPRLPRTWSDPSTAAHILDGEPGDPTKGGHRPGTGRFGKTEFPATWDDAKILDAVASAVLNPGLLTEWNGKRVRDTIVDGVYIHTVAFIEGDQERFQRAHPVSGDGVFLNEDGGRRAVRLTPKQIARFTPPEQRGILPS